MRSWSPWFARRVWERRSPLGQLLSRSHPLDATFHKQIWPGELNPAWADSLTVPIAWGVESKPN
jgi:hypothetical protein